RSGSSTAALFAGPSPSPSALVCSAFSSRVRSRIAARSSGVKPPDFFCLFFVGLIEPSSCLSGFQFGRRGGLRTAAKAPRNRPAAVDEEALARGNARDSQQEHDAVEPPWWWRRRLLRRRRNLPDRPVGGTYAAAVAPARFLAGFSGVAPASSDADESIDRGRPGTSSDRGGLC